MNNEDKIVWSDEHGDLRKKKSIKQEITVDESTLILEIRRLTSGKGRVIIEVTALPNNKSWCKKLIKELKKKLAIGGAYKNNFIELHGEKLEQTTAFLDSKLIKWKKIGG